MSAAPDACPICGKPKEAKFAPFCSSRCVQIDLGRWLKGSYAIPGSEAPKPSREDEEKSED
ncbi:MAG TPA: DNA gyrase inhibitor YacG [Rhizomicrobium sp.]|jgi:endogenous inhibitor of DNA gyrase (YacG/DUF329 family)|nr:DNA gyrase inhibitor YacG [Rhizomicrobium sp.]